MDFIGRHRELADLNRQYAANHAFVVIYGRRRIGKTALIQEFIKGKNALYFLATEESEPQSLARFSQSLSTFTNNDSLADARFTDWLAAFSFFAKTQPEQKKVLVIDEFQYLVNTNPAFTSVFQKAWDEILSKQNIMVIICGSYINMMTRQVLSEKSPLYGRRTAQIRLAPLAFRNIREYYCDKPFSAVVELYAVTGGVPKYLELFDNNAPLMQNIADVVLNTNGFLYEEPAFLLNKEVREPVNYFSIMQAVAQERHKMTEIAATLEIPTSRLGPYLDTLQGLFLLDRKVPATEKYPEKSRKGLYFIRDIFMRFWFKFVFPYKGELELGNVDFVLEKLNKNFIDNHAAFVFEEICRQHFIDCCRNKEIDFVPSRVGSWWDKNNEIDLVAVDENSKRIFAAECKFYNQGKPVDTGVYGRLKEKCALADFNGYALIYGLFSKSGFDKKLRRLAEENKDLQLFDLK